MHNAFFQPALWYSAVPVLGENVHHCNNFFLGGRWVGKKIYIRIGEMSDFVRRKKKSHLCELKGILQEKSSSVAGNAVSSVDPYTMGRRRWTDSLSTHPLPGPHCNPCSSGTAAFLLCWDAGGRHRQPTWKITFCRGYWRALTASHCWTMQTHENEGFMNGNAPQAIALGLGAPGWGDGSSTKAPACGCEQCIMQQMLRVWRSHF